MKLLLYRFFGLALVVSLGACSQEKINGLNLVSPPKVTTNKAFLPIKEVQANWVSVIPYALSKGYTTEVIYNSEKQWWGEKKEGVIALIQNAKAHQLKVMLKPHIWFWGGAATDFSLSSEEEWLAWEKNYSNYILFYARLAEKQNVDLFCFSTELKQVVQLRSTFFKVLIKEIKRVYKGKLTYAANWDNYQNVSFWNELDYIGVDAYFPLSKEREPTVARLQKFWQPIAKELAELSHKINKPVLFTEYGFESTDFNTKETWGSKGKYTENQNAQSNAYQALFNIFYSQNWFSGGFLWKWHLIDSTKRNVQTSFTPQNKEAMIIIKRQFNN